MKLTEQHFQAMEKYIQATMDIYQELNQVNLTNLQSARQLMQQAFPIGAEQGDPVPTLELPITPGQYVSRGGERFNVVKVGITTNGEYPIIGFRDGDWGDAYCWTAEGQYYCEESDPDDYDLVKRVGDPA